MSFRVQAFRRMNCCDWRLSLNKALNIRSHQRLLTVRKKEHRACTPRLCSVLLWWGRVWKQRSAPRIRSTEEQATSHGKQVWLLVRLTREDVGAVLRACCACQRCFMHGYSRCGVRVPRKKSMSSWLGHVDCSVHVRSR